MRIDIVTIFPGMFTGPFRESIIGRAQDEGIVSIHVWDLREFTRDKHRTTDDYPFGGGPGMVMKPDPLVRAVEELKGTQAPQARVILTTPQGRPFDQGEAERLSRQEALILLCGRYEGVDERVRQLVVDEELSLGDYVLTGGELAAMVVTDAVVRLLPGAVGEPASVREDSFTQGLLEGPHYTRPRTFRGLTVPEPLLSGHHAAIARWRRKASLERTLLRRPELLATAALGPDDVPLLEELGTELLAGCKLGPDQQRYLAAAMARATAPAGAEGG